jgi:hypothetical protein
MKFFSRMFGNPALAYPVAGMLLFLSVVLIWMHAVAIRQLKESGLDAAVLLPQMERRLSILNEQVEASQLQESLRSGAPQEQLHMYVLPEKTDLERLLALFDILRDSWQREGVLFTLSPIRIGESAAFSDRLQAAPVAFEAEVTQEGRDLLLLMVRLSGVLTISDALTVEERDALITLTEEENPAALTVLEQFLATDLLAYTQESELYERQVLRSITTEAFEARFTDILEHSTLAKAKFLLSGRIGQLLSNHNLWPTQMLGLKQADVQQIGVDRYRVSLGLEVYTKKK